MANFSNNTIEIVSERRLCIVNGEYGYFHTWDLSDNLSKGMNGVVEFADRVERVVPEKIRFLDDENYMLEEMNKRLKEDKNGSPKEAASPKSENLIKNIEKHSVQTTTYILK